MQLRTILANRLGRLVLSKMISTLLLSLSAQLAPAPKLPPLKPKPNTVQGRCVTMAGKPLADVAIVVNGVTKRGENVQIEVKSNGAGVYSTPVPAGTYHIGRANWETAAPTGPSYWLPLRPIDGDNSDAPAAKGIVEDLVLRVNGKITSSADPDTWTSYYGGTIRISPGYIPQKSFLDPNRWNWPEGAKVQVTLDPLSKLADGTPAKRLTLSAGRNGASGYIYDVPIAKYRVTAQAVLADGSTKPLKVALPHYYSGRSPSANEPAAEELTASGDLYFPAGGTDSTPLLKLPGIAYTTLYVAE